MSAERQAIEAHLEALKGKFIDRCAERADAIEQGLRSGDLQAIAATAHAIAGTAGLFGFGEMGEQAVRAEQAAKTGNDVQPAAAILVASLRKVANRS